MKLMTTLLLLLALSAPIALSGKARAYSYSAAGAEVLIDARETTFAALNNDDFEQAWNIFNDIYDELDYLDQNHDPGLMRAYSSALAAKDKQAVAAASTRLFSAEIERRLAAARESIDDYQVAKVLVVKAQRFLGVIAADLAPEQHQRAELGIAACLKAIGNPGVFGVGQEPADPAAYDAAFNDVLSALGQ